MWHFSDVLRQSSDVRFSNRPFGVKHFQTIHQCDVDVARGLVLLFGIGTGAFPSWDSRTRRNNLLVGLAVEERRVQADIRTHLIHRPARDIFPPLGGALVFSYRVHAAAVACSLVQQNSVVNPYAMHDHGEPACQGHDRLFHPAAPGDLHGPRLEPGPFF